MSFFAKYGKPKAVKPSKGIGAKEMLKINIDKQERLLKGEVVNGVKGNPIRSWFKRGKFNPTVGIYGLFGSLGFLYKEGAELEMLKDFEAAFVDGEFDEYINNISLKKKAK